MNTECKDCKFREGNCGHHFLFNGVVNYDIPSLSACDRYGNCWFFKPKEKPQGDLISREALKKTFDDYIKSNPNVSGIFEVGKFIIDNAPTVAEDYDTGYQDGLEDGLNDILPQGTNASLFKQIYGISATEMWSMSESQFLEWLNSEYDCKEADDETN